MSNDTKLVTQRPNDAVPKNERQTRGLARQTPVIPAVDVFEDGHGITLYADLPGVTREKLEIRVQDGNLTIEAEAVVPTPAGLRLQHGEIRYPRFARAFAVSADFDVSRIDAYLRDGVLRLAIPRREEAKPRRIEVMQG